MVYKKLKCHQAQVFIRLDSVGQEVYVNEENQTLMFIYYHTVQKTYTKHTGEKR